MVRQFVNRTRELDALERWWSQGAAAALVWGRRRVGKTALLQRFATGKPTVFVTGANRGEAYELALLAGQAAQATPGGLRDLAARPFVSWDDALDDLAQRAAATPTLLVLDEFPELVASTPALEGVLRAFLDRSAGQTRLRVLICGSAVRSMAAMQEARAPLYGRFDLSMLVHPFEPHEAAAMLPDLSPADRALVWGIVGGMPLYLSWWDQTRTVDQNLMDLVLSPGARLLTEGDLVLRTDIEGGDQAWRALNAIANGRTQWNEIRGAIGAEPARTLDRLEALHLVEQIRPVGSSASTRRKAYRLTDPFLAFHLGPVNRHRTSIERGLGRPVLRSFRSALDEHMGWQWEEAFRRHLRRAAAAGALPVAPVAELGAWWDASGEHEIDALGLSARPTAAVLAGEAKWASSADASRLIRVLRTKVADGVHVDPDDLLYVACARERLTNVPEGALAITAADVFG